MKKILVPTDFSPAAWQASVYAAKMAAHLVQQQVPSLEAAASGAETALFADNFGFDEPEPKNNWSGAEVVYLADHTLKATEDAQLQAWTQKLREHAGNTLQLSYESATGSGSSAEKIVRSAAALGADLIVMGASGEGSGSNLSRKMIGSTTTGVMRHCRQPLLIVPENFTFKLPKQIVFATDYGHICRSEDMVMLAELTKLFGASLKLLHVHKPVPQPQDEEKTAEAEHIIRLLEEQGLQVGLDFAQHPDPATGIEQYVEQHKADWLVMVPHWHSLFSRMLKESVTSRLAYETRIPLLTFPMS